MVQGIRFDPPRITLSPEVRWLVLRAFGPETPRPSTSKVADGVRLAETAERLDLMARIAGRTPFDALEAELGGATAGRFRDEFRTAAGRTVLFEWVGSQVAEVAAALALPLVFLKGMALHLSGQVRPGTRSSSDVDVLAPSTRTDELQQALISLGYRLMEIPSAEHQLPPLVHPAGVMIEVHRMVRGVRLKDAVESATCEGLLEAGLCRPVESLAEGCHVPCEDVLLAHLLVHGIAQHGLSASYPLTRVLADVQDVDMSAAQWGAFLDGPYEWIARDVSREEMAAVADVTARMARGEDPASVVGGHDGASVVLRHVLVVALDEEYRRSQRLRALASPLPANARLGTLLLSIFRTVWLTRPQVESLYGVPRSSLGYWGWRLWRPFDLVVRLVRYGAAWVRHRGGRGRFEL